MLDFTFIGRLGRDPEINSSKSKDGQREVKIARLSLCCDSKIYNKETKKPNQSWVQVTLFNKKAENAMQYYHKGDLLLVKGEVQPTSYVNKDGNTVYTTNYNAERVELLSKSNNAGTAGNKQVQNTPDVQYGKPVAGQPPFAPNDAPAATVEDLGKTFGDDPLPF